jgi:hypothetical protein
MLDLPTDVLRDKAEATFKNGVLEVKIPKKKPTKAEKTDYIPQTVQQTCESHLTHTCLAWIANTRKRDFLSF